MSDPRPVDDPPPAPPARPPEPSARLRVQVVSDLHVDVADTGRLRLAPGADLLVVAGDTCAGTVEGFAHLRRVVPGPTPIVVVAGNHEFYGATHSIELARARAAAPDFGIVFLEDEAAVIGGVRFLGSTLWTDYRLFGERHRPVAMAVARRGLNDHRVIAWGDARRGFRPEEAAGLHAASRAFLAAALARPCSGPTVVVSHHAPHPVGIAPGYARDPLSAAFASDLTGVIGTGAPDLWVFGHTHHPVDRVVGATRLVANPHGYRDECRATFDPARVIDVPLAPRREGRP
ncbi:metallophosphoesterase [Methylobacterium brachiatum]|uniref:metallophosphoesterase n=1 Tax=Methylobacterium brachiatum TaxID=269660 RepID=UPI00331599FC